MGTCQRVVVLGVCLYLASAAGIVARQAPAGDARSSVWDGIFTDAQAERGRGFFAEHCASCHGGDLRGGESKALVDRRFWSDWQETTVDYLSGAQRQGVAIASSMFFKSNFLILDEPTNHLS